MKSFERLYHDTPGPAKTVFVIIGTVLVGGAIYEIWKNSQKAKDLAAANKTGSAAAAEIPGLEAQGMVRTLDDVTLQSMIADLVQNLNGCGYDQQAVGDLFAKFKNKLDLLYFMKLFGVQYYRPCAATQPISYARWLIDDTAYGGDLGTFMGYKLNSTTMDWVYRILQAEGIDIQF